MILTDFVEWTTNIHTHKKSSVRFSVCGSINVHAQSPIWATDMRFCLILPQARYYMSANNKTHLLVAYVISILFLVYSLELVIL